MQYNNKIIFEGEIYRKLVKRINQNKIKYKNLDLSKTWFSDLIPNYTKEENISYSNLLKIFLSSIFKIFFIQYRLHKLNSGKDKIWILTSPSSRISHRNFFKSETRSKAKPSLISWEKKIKIKGLKVIYYDILFYLKLINSLKNITSNKNKILDTAHKSLISKDLYDNLSNILPTAIFSLKDFQRFENAIIQKANILKIKTFTTQHAVHPNFTGKNERGGNLVFYNNEAKNILLWGNFCKTSYIRYRKKKKFYIFKNFLTPIKQNINSKKYTLLVCMGSFRHIQENAEMLKLILKKKSFFKKNYIIYIKLHPAISKHEFNFKFKNLLREFKYKIINSKSKISYIYGKNTFAITGLSGSYYDCLYLGIKTLFFDYKFSVSKKLPRAAFNINKNSDLRKSISKLKKISNKEWKKRSNIVLKNVWNLSINQKIQGTLTDNISTLV